jgi:hypothetical protein
MSFRLKRTTQCAKCPWRVDIDPHDIPNGYSEDKHCGLKNTISKPGDVGAMFAPGIRVMACHEMHDAHCIGWLMNQLGPGNNLALRMHIRNCENMREVKLLGEQHKRFEDTLPAH